ncbi:DUF6933 domain-containing protein [Burkholderia cenocepacia]|uniref:DUF6933 domain-containing protein n=1 Tax=Burkholderia cenocepacia TaxID=95486 RepID=UPI003F73EAE9
MARFWSPQVALLVNECTLLPIRVPLAPAAILPARFPEAPSGALSSHGGTIQIDAEMQHMCTREIVRTADRSIVGILNEFAYLRKFGKGSKAHRISINSR